MQAFIFYLKTGLPGLPIRLPVFISILVTEYRV